MFVCQITGQISERGEALNRIVVAKRERIYYEDYFNDETREWEQIEIGRGWEVVKEVNASADGLSAWNALSDDERDSLSKKLCKGKH